MERCRLHSALMFPKASPNRSSVTVTFAREPAVQWFHGVVGCLGYAISPLVLGHGGAYDVSRDAQFLNDRLLRSIAANDRTRPTPRHIAENFPIVCDSSSHKLGPDDPIESADQLPLRYGSRDDCRCPMHCRLDGVCLCAIPSGNGKRQ